MRSEIYGRFQIVKAIVNGVFEALDRVDDAPVTLYEWTPTPAERENAAQRIGQFTRLQGVELFSADASFYLAAKSPQQAASALEVLRRERLFTDAAPIQTTIPPPLPPPGPLPMPAPPTPVVIPAHPSNPGATAARWIGVIVALIVFSILGAVVGYNMSSSESRPKIEEANAELVKARQDLADANQRADSSDQSKKQFEGIYLFRLENRCDRVIRVATLYKGPNGLWVTEGWQNMPVGQTVMVTAIPSPDLYVYGLTEDGRTEWADSSSSIEMDIVSQNFAYLRDTGLADSSRRSVKPRHYHASSTTFSLKWTCG